MRIVILATACILQSMLANQSTPGADSSGWRKMADAFMGDIVAKKIDEALDLVGPEFIKGAGRANARSTIEHLFDYCGRPLDMEFQHEERGFKDYGDGRRKELRAFFYDATTDQSAKGVCRFHVDVVPVDTDPGYAVTAFGPRNVSDKWAGA
jgi:hypothetical protein